MTWSKTCYSRKSSRMITRRRGLHVTRFSYRALHLHGQHLPGKATTPSLEVYDSSQSMTTTDLYHSIRFDSQTDSPWSSSHRVGQLGLAQPMRDLSVQYPAPVNMARSCLLDMQHEIFHQICKGVLGGDESLQLPV
jgi:hypothetical protein